MFAHKKANKVRNLPLESRLYTLVSDSKPTEDFRWFVGSYCGIQDVANRSITKFYPHNVMFEHTRNMVAIYLRKQVGTCI